MNEIQLINWLSTKCYFTIRNSFTGAFMEKNLVIFYIKAEVRLKDQVVTFDTQSKEEIYYALNDMKIQVEKWYEENAQEYL